MSKMTALFAAFGSAGDFRALCSDDVVIVGVRAEPDDLMPLYGTFVGPEGVERFIAGLQAAYEPQLFVIDATLENDEIGFAAGRVEHRLRGRDACLRTHWAVRCSFENGLLKTYRFYEDTAATEEAFGIRTSSREALRSDEELRASFSQAG